MDKSELFVQQVLLSLTVTSSGKNLNQLSLVFQGISSSFAVKPICDMTENFHFFIVV